MTEIMNITLEDQRSISINMIRGEIEIWLHDSLTRTQKLLAKYQGGKYSEVDPELFRVMQGGNGIKIMRALRQCFDEPQAEFTRRWTCFKRLIVLKVLTFRRSHSL